MLKKRQTLEKIFIPKCCLELGVESMALYSGKSYYIFFIINQPDALISQIYFGGKFYMFRAFPLSIIRSFSLYTQQWYIS